MACRLITDINLKHAYHGDGVSKYNCKPLNGSRRAMDLLASCLKEQKVRISEWKPEGLRNKEVDACYFQNYND